MENKYYILPFPNQHSSLWTIVVENESTVTKLENGTKIIVKLPLGDNKNHAILNGLTPLTQQQAFEIVQANAVIEPNIKKK